jgi:membrane-bound lytic murein transglycosylase F
MRIFLSQTAIPFMFLILLFSFSCKNPGSIHHKRTDHGDLSQIMERGTLVVITDFNATDYFVYRGQPMGYQYELLQELADHLQIKLEVVVSNDLKESFNCLLDGKCDLIALNLTITKERKKFLEFTEPHSQTRQVLVQRKPEGWQKETVQQLERQLIRNQLELAGKTVYVQQNSAYASRLRNLSDEIGDSIHIIETPEDAEQLISLVAGGDLDYTVSDENVALVNQTYFKNIDISTAVSFPQNLAWAVNKEAVELKKEINEWLVGFKETARYRVIYNKYFQNQRTATMVQSDYFTISSGKISAWDDVIRKYSQEIGWDWRLVASLIYQESRFDPHARSWAGAYGLMQLMPATAARFGLKGISSPGEQIRAGTEFLKWLDDRFRDQIPDDQERIKFILASYNIGPGHILDAINLADKFGKDAKLWDGNVDEYLLKKSSPLFYRDPVVKYGYCRGSETVDYVTQVLERYEHYRNIIPDETSGDG